MMQSAQNRRFDYHLVKSKICPKGFEDVQWLDMKEHYFKIWIAKTHEELEDRMVWVIRQISDNSRVSKIYH
ncbi:MAG: hypothetical protein V2A61_01360 [Calditrichota bacterium]